MDRRAADERRARSGAGSPELASASAQPRHRGHGRRWLAIAVTVVAALALAAPSCQTNIHVSGTLYRDLDGDGTRDAGEPAMAGIKVFLAGNPSISVTTSASGAWTLSVAPSTSSIQVGTGWFKGGCDSRSCPADAHGWELVNQVIRLTVPDQSVTGADLGLVPDWPGGIGPIPDPVGGVVPANGTDLAARLSTSSQTGCTGGALSICGPGSQLSYVAQVLNQGTEDATGVVAALSVPFGDCVKSIRYEPSTGPAGLDVYTDPETFSCSTRLIELHFTGTLTAGSQARIMIDGKVGSGPGTPGCTSSPTAECSRVEPQGRSWVFALERVDRPDADGDYCASLFPPISCGTGIHDKRYEPDDVDGAGHNVPFEAGDPTTMNLGMGMRLGTPVPAGGYHQGDAIVLQAIVSNTGPPASSGQADSGWVVRTYLPGGGTRIVDWPGRLTGAGDSNPIVGCTAAQGDVPVLTCTGKGPIPAGAASVAITFTASIPSTWPTAYSFAAVSCVSPGGGQSETVPGGGACSAWTIPSQTATDNDAGVSTPVGT